MFGSVILEVVIGLTFIYLLVSLVCSAVVEAVGAMFNRRGNTLEASLKLILGDKASEILAHPLIKSVVPSVTKPPHVDPEQFVSVIVAQVQKAIEIATVAGGDPVLETLKTKFSHNGAQAPIVKILELFLAETSNDLEKLRIRLILWFEQEMDQLSAWYKRRTVAWLTLAALMVTVFVNVDSIALTKTLLLNPTQREKLADLATTRLELEQKYPTPENNSPTGTKPAEAQQPLEPTKMAIDVLLGTFQKAEIDLGKPFQFLRADFPSIVSTLLGYVLTIVATSLGAPFWFDLLGKLVNLRLAFKPAQTHARKT